ncbi:hypothetical protein C8R46DRAFT_1063555 [Mycena filopes]|nr:hypothetical protein C8R46DRAFT_1063555 [Mycena filopes]
MADYEAELLRNTETAVEVYHRIQTEFFDWKDGYVSTSPLSSFAFRMAPATFDPLPNPIPKAEDRDADAFIYEWTYDADGKPDEGKAVPVNVVAGEPLDQFLHHPPYQYCTPASRNENARVAENRDAPFMPFPEDPTFPRDAYLDSFTGSVQWVVDQPDPDDEVIQYETVRRLHVEHGFSAGVIDEILRVKGLPLLRSSNESGLLWAVTQRDLLPVVWGDGLPSSSKPQLPPHFAREHPASNDLFRHINTGREKFCPNLNCVNFNCHIHIDYDWGLITPPVIPKPPGLTSAQLLRVASEGHACSNACFRSIREDDMEDDDGVADVHLRDLAVLNSLLKLEPDTIPCDLATICNMSCRNVFLHRRDTIDDTKIISARTQQRKVKRNQGSKTINIGALTLTIAPCAHPGSCFAALCECYQRKIYCERNCRCDNKCRRRWKGCKTTCRRTRDCGKRCKCREAGRECDPELCLDCDARDVYTHFPNALPAGHVRGKCTNVALQRGTFKKFIVHTSQYGLGAFAAEDIRVGDILGEYVGELVDEVQETVVHRGIVQRHSGLNYTAQWLGNPTRFLNDSKPKRPNCVALGLSPSSDSTFS